MTTIEAANTRITRLGPPRRLAYGPTDFEKLDIYMARQPNAPMNVFIHGGAWRAGSAADVAYMSETFVDAGSVLTTDWQKDFGLPPNIVKGGLCCSGMYDLHPVSLSARSIYVKFTKDVVEALSPLHRLDTLVAPVVIVYGTLETPEFQRQSRKFAAAVKAAGKPVTLLVGEGYNHFEIMETLGNPYGPLGRAALGQMKLGG